MLDHGAVLLHAAVQHIPPQISMAAARDEAEMVLFNSVGRVLEEARLKPGQVSSLADVHACVIGLCCCVYCAQQRPFSCFAHAAHMCRVVRGGGGGGGGGVGSLAGYLGMHHALHVYRAAIVQTPLETCNH